MPKRRSSRLKRKREEISTTPAAAAAATASSRRPRTGVRVPAAAASSSSRRTGGRTPAVSRRRAAEAKRQAPAERKQRVVVDLTLSDEEIAAQQHRDRIHRHHHHRHHGEMDEAFDDEFDFMDGDFHPHHYHHQYSDNELARFVTMDVSTGGSGGPMGVGRIMDFHNAVLIGGHHHGHGHGHAHGHHHEAVPFDGDVLGFLFHLMSRVHHMGPRGLTAAQSDSLPVSEVSQIQETEDCVICLGEMAPGNIIKRLPCLHTFHKSCIDEWVQQSSKCPIDMCEIFS